MTMTRREFDDETLMAFADGEVDAETAAAVKEAMAHDDRIAARVALFVETRQRAKAEMSRLLEQPVPPGLEAAVRLMVQKSRQSDGRTASADDNVVAFRREAAGSGRMDVRSWTLPLAASLVAAVAAGLLGYQLGVTGRQAGLAVTGDASGVVAEALSSLPSGEEQRLSAEGQQIRMVASFRDEAGALCREYEIHDARSDSLIAVACREDGTWSTRLAIRAPREGGGYAPASSIEALDVYLAAINAGPPLNREEEARILSQLR
jgi:anti-sigma factor RsiW